MPKHHYIHDSQPLYNQNITNSNPLPQEKNSAMTLIEGENWALHKYQPNPHLDHLKIHKQACLQA